MKCFSCELESPVNDARFCVYCGKPLAQASPYTDPSEEKMLPLRDASGKPPHVCRYTKLPLKSCPKCGRLHTLGQVTCVGCGAELREGRIPFPSRTGALDGSRSVDWPGVFPPTLPQYQKVYFQPVAAPLPVEVRAMVYRYGWLALATPNGLMFLEVNGADVTRNDAFPPVLFSQGREDPLDLLADNGRFYVRCAQASFVFRLPGSEEARIPEIPLRQAKSPRWWVRLVRDGARCALRCRRCDGSISGEADYGVAIDALPEQVLDMAVADSGPLGDEATVYLAIRDGRLLRWRATAGRIETAPAAAMASWNRVAVAEGGAFAAGYAAGGMTLTLAFWRDDLTGGAPPSKAAQPVSPLSAPPPPEKAAVEDLWATFGSAPTATAATPPAAPSPAQVAGQAFTLSPQDPGCSTDFALSEDQIFILSEVGYAVLERRRFPAKAESIALPSGRTTQEGLLVLRDIQGEERLLLFREDRFGVQMQLARRTFLTDIGSLLGKERPLYCIADGVLFLLSTGGGQTMLSAAVLGDAAPS